MLQQWKAALSLWWPLAEGLQVCERAKLGVEHAKLGPWQMQWPLSARPPALEVEK